MSTSTLETSMADDISPSMQAMILAATEPKEAVEHSADYRCGVAALVGRPNVGKSTLMNRLLGQKVAIATPKVQTTRVRQLGILTEPDQNLQCLFVDTPGFSKPLDTLGENMMQHSHQALADCDCVLMLVDGTVPAGSGDAWLAEQVKKANKPIILIINKIDRIRSNPELTKAYAKSYAMLFQDTKPFSWVSISAQSGRGTQKIVPLLSQYMPLSPPMFDEDTLTDQRTRDIAAEMIREQAMLLTNDELPHAVAVMIDEFNETDAKCIRIIATLYVERETQKGIMIGKHGALIKKIGQGARHQIEHLVGTQVFLDLRVKVKDNWRKDPAFLKTLGLS